MLRVIWLGMVLILTISTIFAALSCSGPASPAVPAQSSPSSASQPQVSTSSSIPSSQPTSSGTTSPTSTKKFNFKWNSWSAPNIPVSNIRDEWAKRIEKRTGGMVHIDLYYSSSLLAYADAFRGIQSGVANCGSYIIGNDVGIHPFNEMMNLPMMDWPDMKAGTEIYIKLRQKFPEFEKEWGKTGVKLLWGECMPFNEVHMIKKPVRVAEDMKGAKIYGSGGWIEALPKVSAAAVRVAPGDWYTSLSTGLIEGMVTHWAVVHDYKLQELFKYHTFISGGASMLCAVMNLDSWNSLPSDFQKIIQEESDWAAFESVRSDQSIVENAIKEAKDVMKHELIYITPEQRSTFINITQEYNNKWITNTEAKGYPGKAAYDEAKRLAAGYK
jgi:TRAP-type C4-dicarboxylate transport system substrate-binding protein